jgi:hypothetical protein
LASLLLASGLTAAAASTNTVDRTKVWGEIFLMAHKSHNPMDAAYYCPTEAELPRLFPKMHHKWQSQIWDCDDIAQETVVVVRRQHLRSKPNFPLCVGIIAYCTGKDTAHAALVVRLNTGEWRVFDPARHRWLKLPKKILWVQL